MRLFLPAFCTLVLTACQPSSPADPSAFQTASQDDLYIEGRVQITADGFVLGFPRSRIDFNPVGDEISLYVTSEKDGVALDVSRDGKPYQRKTFHAGEWTLHFCSIGFPETAQRP